MNILPGTTTTYEVRNIFFFTMDVEQILVKEELESFMCVT